MFREYTINWPLFKITMNSLSFLRINYKFIFACFGSTKWNFQNWSIMNTVFYQKRLNDEIADEILSQNICIFHILKNIKSEFLRKFWVETYVYLIYSDQPARFDPFLTSFTQVWPLMTLIDLEKYLIWFETYVYWIHFD